MVRTMNQNPSCNGPKVTSELFTDFPDYDHPDSQGVPLTPFGDAMTNLVHHMFSQDIIEVTIKINKGGKVTYRSLHGGSLGNLRDLVI